MSGDTGNAANNAPPPLSAQRFAGKYMSFKLGAEEYGVGILTVRELIGLMPITRIPATPPFIRGVINLRGRVIPVMDLRTRLGMRQIEPTDQTVVIVIECRPGDATVMGVLVDEVTEVINIAPDDVEPPPSFGPHSDANSFTLALGKLDGRVICLLDIVKLLSGSGHDRLEHTLQPA